jgi:hypothetical protein
MTDFFLTLASNSSMSYYPDNKTSNFTVQLPKTITLEGKWNVALAEVHYQNTFLNVSEGSNSISYRQKMYSEMFSDTEYKLEKCIFECGNYENIEDIVKAINSLSIGDLKGATGTYLKYDKTKEKVFIDKTSREEFSEMYFDNRLAHQFGYDSYSNALLLTEKNIRKGQVNQGIPDEMIIYCDIVEPQMFAHSFSKVIRIVNIDKNALYGTACQKEFLRLNYIPILKKEFETISIELRDKVGNFLPFNYGTTMFVLHFKKVE